jgi:hypothetical protein
MQSSAPATIPLWYIDEKTGLWKEEGIATRQGNNYVGTVSHFSFWNCDTGISGVTLSATLKTSTGQPLVNAWVVINAGKIGSASGYTDSAGQVRGLVPAGTDLVLEVRDNCGSAIYSKNIGPYNENIDIGMITVSSTAPTIVTISGKLTNCGGGIVSNGYAIVAIDQWVHYAKVDAGVFPLIMYCVALLARMSKCWELMKGYNSRELRRVRRWLHLVPMLEVCRPAVIPRHSFSITR